MVEIYSEVMDIEIISVASVTVKRSDLSKAFEADESYCVTHAVQLLAKKELDFEVDPPPDLVIEVEMTSSAINKMHLLAAVRVLEVWRHDGEVLEMYRWVDGSYQLVEPGNQLPAVSRFRKFHRLLR